MDKRKYAIVILAAGSSQRLGQPKQLVSFNQSTLLNNTLKQAAKVDNADPIVILGSNSSIIQSSLTKDVTVFVNPNWNEGFGASLAFGVRQIMNSAYAGVIISVCDQPYLSTEHYVNLISKFEEGRQSIIISKYKIGSGPPTLFSQVHFDSLTMMDGDSGAKSFINQNLEMVENVEFELGYIDIDTQKDLDKLNRN